MRRVHDEGVHADLEPGLPQRLDGVPQRAPVLRLEVEVAHGAPVALLTLEPPRVVAPPRMRLVAAHAQAHAQVHAAAPGPAGQVTPPLEHDGIGAYETAPLAPAVGQVDAHHVEAELGGALERGGQHRHGLGRLRRGRRHHAPRAAGRVRRLGLHRVPRGLHGHHVDVGVEPGQHDRVAHLLALQERRVVGGGQQLGGQAQHLAVAVVGPQAGAEQDGAAPLQREAAGGALDHAGDRLLEPHGRVVDPGLDAHLVHAQLGGHERRPEAVLVERRQVDHGDLLRRRRDHGAGPQLRRFGREQHRLDGADAPDRHPGATGVPGDAAPLDRDLPAAVAGVGHGHHGQRAADGLHRAGGDGTGDDGWIQLSGHGRGPLGG